jgi:hypothetical protein
VVVAIAVVAVATLMPAGVARADVAFRKKKPTTSDSATEASPSGGEVEGKADAPAADDEAPAAAPAKTDFVPQAEDKDRPRDPSLLDQRTAEAQLAAKAKKKDEGPPFYTKWQFWAIAGGIAVGLVAAIWGGSKLVHEANGGDVRPCGMSFNDGCYGQGH